MLLCMMKTMVSSPPPPPLILGGPGTDKILDFRGGFNFRYFQGGDLIFPGGGGGGGLLNFLLHISYNCM